MVLTSSEGDATINLKATKRQKEKRMMIQTYYSVIKQFLYSTFIKLDYTIKTDTEETAVVSVDDQGDVRIAQEKDDFFWVSSEKAVSLINIWIYSYERDWRQALRPPLKDGEEYLTAGQVQEMLHEHVDSQLPADYPVIHELRSGALMDPWSRESVGYIDYQAKKKREEWQQEWREMLNRNDYDEDWLLKEIWNRAVYRAGSG